MIYRFIAVLLFSILYNSSLVAQQPAKPNAVQIHNAIQKLNFLGSVLYVAAHPDDENTRLISYMSNAVKARTAYLSLTRGDGGQNLIGPEIRELLGVIRTQELLAARRTDGGEQIFSRANDFGFSKHPDETLTIWDKKEVLSDVVWAIRKFQPDIIINRFDHRTPGTTHGHHTTSAMLSVEAFDLTNDKNSYPEQLQSVQPWQPKRLFFNTSWWFYGSRDNFAKADKTNLIKMDAGSYYKGLGLSNTEIASLSRSQHKSQGFGNTGTRGSQDEYIELIKGEMPAVKSNLFEGIDTTWKRVKGGGAIGEILNKVEKDFNFRNPAASVPELMRAYSLIQKLENKHWKEIKSNEIKEIIAACTGLYLEAVAVEQTITKGSKIQINTEVINRSDIEMVLNKIAIPNLNIINSETIKLTDNERENTKLEGTIGTNESFTSPYWLQDKGSLGMYKVTDQQLIGQPETPRKTKALFHLSINGTAIEYEKDVVYKMNDPVKGEVYKPFEITPKVSLHLADKVIIFANNTPKTVSLTIISGQNNISGTASLQIPSGWKVTPEKVDVNLQEKGAEQTIDFVITPPSNQNEGYIKPEVIIEGTTFSDEVVHINYEHIPYQTVILPSETKVVRLDIEKKGQQIGYIEGAGDIVPESLRQIGYTVTTIDPTSISENNLKDFDAIVVGIRAYNTVESLKFKQKHLLKYVENGGNLIIQYNTNRRLKVQENLGPYPLTVSRDRVTDENADITLIAKEHPVLNTPNKITNKDFEGWVQERGLYFPNEWDDKYVPIMELHDKGESEKKGALLIAKYGKGYYVYTGLSFFREFPAGVSGAYRLFANMISLGK